MNRSIWTWGVVQVASLDHDKIGSHVSISSFMFSCDNFSLPDQD